MDTAGYISFYCYLLAALGSVAIGLLYLTRKQSMPYHQEALGLTWQQHDPHLQALLLALMRALGGVLLAAGLCLLVMLIIPYRNNMVWAQITVPVINLIIVSSTLYATIYVHRQTGAHSPVSSGVVFLALVVVGIIFSLV